MDDRLPLYLARLPKSALVRQWIVAIANVMIASSFAAGAIVVLAQNDEGAALAGGVTGALAVIVGSLAAWNVSGLIKAWGTSVPAVIIEVTQTGYRFATPLLKTWRNRRELARGSKVRIHCLTVDGSQWRGSTFVYTLWTDDVRVGFWVSAPVAKDSLDNLRRLIASRGGTLEVAAMRPSSRRGASSEPVTFQRLTPAPGSPASALVTLADRDITLVPFGGDGKAQPGWPERLRDEDASDHFLSVEAPMGSTVVFVATFEEPAGMELAASEDFQGWTRLVSLLDDGMGVPLHIATEVAVSGAAFYKDAAGTKVVLHLHAVEPAAAE